MPGTAEETMLLSYCERMRSEGRQGKAGTDAMRTDEYLRMVRGDQWPTNLPRGFVDFTINMIGDVVSRKAALLTDSRPILQVTSSNKSLTRQEALIEQLLRSIWDSASWQEELPRAIAMSEISGAVAGLMTWDQHADNRRGMVSAEVIDIRNIAIDPAVTRAAHLQDGEFVVTDMPSSVPALIEKYGPRAYDVRPDAGLSTVPDDNAEVSGVGIASRLAGAFRRGSRNRRRQPQASVIPRAWERHYWFRDWQRYSVDEPMDGQPIYTRPRIIRHVVAAGGVILRDESNPFWHGMFPHEIFDWGMELDHPYGISEVKNIRSAQQALNRLGADILKNAMLNNNFKVIGDQNALEAEEWAKLSNRPSVIIRKRQGTQLTFEAPPALPGYLFNIIQFLIQTIEMVSGLSEVTRGQRPGGVQSGVALEGLALAAQTLIRLQARRLESWIQRMWDKAISMCFQFYTADRVLSMVGPGNSYQTFVYEHAAMHLGVSSPSEAHRDFSMHVTPGSSLTASKVQKAVLASQLFRMGLIPREEVLRASEWPNPEATLKKAEDDAKHLAELQQSAGGHQPQRRGFSNSGANAIPGAGRRHLQSFPAGGDERK